VTWAVVPLKSPALAKSRLSRVLDPQARQQLFFAMARHVIATARSAAQVTRLLVVTASDAVANFARVMGCEVATQDSDSGTADAFEVGIRHARDHGPARLLLLPGDLPFLTRDAIQALLSAVTLPNAVAIAPDATEIGTNALVLGAAATLPMCFGHDSFRRHMHAASALGLPVSVLRRCEFAFDLDEEAHLRRLNQWIVSDAPLAALRDEAILARHAVA
jgi:2-phospho-L-lactate/phosphoenolpyruvate guanylyltransferase